MNPTLDPAQAAFRRQFAQLCRERVAPHAAAADRDGAVSADAWRAVVGAGYLGLFHPRALGGSDADGVTLAIARTIGSRLDLLLIRISSLPHLCHLCQVFVSASLRAPPCSPW